MVVGVETPATSALALDTVPVCPEVLFQVTVFRTPAGPVTVESPPVRPGWSAANFTATLGRVGEALTAVAPANPEATASASAARPRLDISSPSDVARPLCRLITDNKT